LLNPDSYAIFRNSPEFLLNYFLDELKHEPVNCSQCNQAIILKDINIFGDVVKEKLYRRALINYLKAQSNYIRIDECGKCKTLFVIEDSDIGVYRCHDNKCRYMSCCVCGKSVMANNKADMDQHKVCWGIRKHTILPVSLNTF